jgi:hypothetical protein
MIPSNAGFWEFFRNKPLFFCVCRASSARQESDRACDTYRQVHDRTLSELQSWKSNAASRYEPIHNEVSAVMSSLFGGSVSSGSSSFVSKVMFEKCR